MKWTRNPTVILLAIAVVMAALLAGCGKKPDNAEQGGAAGTATPSPSASAPASSPAASPSASEPATGVDPNASHPIVKIEMEDGGIITAELYPEVAPNTVNNFISLIKQGFYDGLIFHRVIPGFMIQGGDPDGNGTGGPGYAIKGEFASNGFENNLKHARGVLSMARQGDPYMDTAGSQFFIMTEDSPHLDGGYAAFGKVTEGLETVDAIVNQPTGEQNRPLEPMKIKTVTVDTLGVEYAEPEKIQS